LPEKDNLKINLKNSQIRPPAIEVNPRTVIALLLLMILLVSLAFYFKSNFHKAYRIFFFPEHQSGKPIGENRKTPRILSDKEQNMDIFVRELLLGPVGMNLDPIFPSGTRLEKIIYRNKTLFLDLNFMALLPDKRAVHGFGYSILLIEKNIKFNFPYVEKVIVTILGQEPEIDV